MRMHPWFDDTSAAVVEVRGKLYMVLTSGKEQLAVFRVRTMACSSVWLASP